MTAKQIQIRSLLLEEFRKGSTDNTAVANICKVLGKKAVGYPTAKLWFQRFKNGDTSLRNLNEKDKTAKDAKYEQALSNDNFLKTHKSILFEVVKQLRGNMVTYDGRIGYALDSNDNRIVMMDFFHGKVK
jgi:hypothetical protein